MATIEIKRSEQINEELRTVLKILDLLKIYKERFLITNRMTPNKFDDFMTKLFPKFKDDYPTLYKLSVENTYVDMKMAYDMVNKMIDINDEKINIDDARKQFGEDLAEKYVYPLVGKNK